LELEAYLRVRVRAKVRIRVRVGLVVGSGLGFGLGASLLLIAGCRCTIPRDWVPVALHDTRPILKRQNDGKLVLLTFLMAMEIDYLIHADCQRIVPVQADTKLHNVFLNYRRVQA